LSVRLSGTVGFFFILLFLLVFYSVFVFVLYYVLPEWRNKQLIAWVPNLPKPAIALLQPWLCRDFRGKLSPLAGIQWTNSQQAMKGKEQKGVLPNWKK